MINQEISKYINDCYEVEDQIKLEDVYVTDHKKVEPKRLTVGEEEDAEFFEYQKSIDEYNNDIPAVKFHGKEKSLYERGTVLQRLLDPLSECGKDENGTYWMEMTDKDFSHFDLENEVKAIKEYESIKKNKSVWDLDAEAVKV